MIALGHFLIILIGTLLLCLPVSTRSGEPESFLDALFTATSATCVTGLVVADTYQNWSMFGQTVLLVLIQIGGLGFMTIGVFFAIYMRRRITLKTRGLLQESVNTLKISGILRLTKMILFGTLFFEGIGAVCLAVRFIPRMGVTEGLYNAVFHSVSAFCNAGFDLMGKYGEYSSVTAFYADPVVNLTLMALIVIGGIGFIVWDDIKNHTWHFRKYMLHTKLVLVTTAVLIFGGALVFGITEYSGTMEGMTAGEQILASLFASVTARTAGFNTIDTGAMSHAGILLTIVLMYIGGSPGSTAGGVKTTTFTVMILNLWRYLKGRYGANAFGRRLEESAVTKATLVCTINLLLAVAAAVAILAVQPALMIEDVLFEVFSAIGTAGMSTGITRDLNTVSRCIVILLMYCGRIGSMTFALSFTHRGVAAPTKYPEEKITVG